MSLILSYTPNQGFTLNRNEFQWGEDRTHVHQKLGSPSEKDNLRDIYEDYNGSENYFFLTYNPEGQLKELEVHEGLSVQTNGFELEFGNDLPEIIKHLSRLGFRPQEMEPGHYLFAELKMVLSTDESMGGEGNGLSYFYAAQTITHLIEE
ncbi:hypothetical protein KFE98_06180 [bacterium SCSIO 12741]|nr:hypothetical protein KFE98_06180 [bacterium SCSIO 12741]